MKSNVTEKKAVLKKWWFWLIIIIILIGLLTPNPDNDADKKHPQSPKNTKAEDNTKDKESTDNSEDDELSFNVSKVHNDATGNWRISLISENIEVKDIALDYYKKYFKNDDEIHAIINFSTKTTTKLAVVGNLIDVSVFEYVDGEEHDAKTLFGGTLLKEYQIDKDTGEVEEIY